MLEHRGNVLAQACSGNGKRIAMAALILSRANKNFRYPHILGVVSTSEAALQLKQAMLTMMTGQLKFTVHSAVEGETS